ncbi:MAG: sigma-70 family RNA polymerase sigma factor [Armatimonadetes bacterium]|nr:sigma-70 family RNA polymerase sigma factor [Armatimonadota bacterium]MBS1712503.1 sigma-70 family RNA polymerase sigma factor [Armatimonadota bacterium]MBX3109188.1 sigma-70 family RNA polymerase sigma factor [Fimbriimonadaceae bacterium]
MSAPLSALGAIHDATRMGIFTQRNPRDFERAVSPELPVLYRVARRLGCSPEEAEDLVQTCLLKAFKAWERFDGCNLRSWLIKILRNERLMVIRSYKEALSLEDHAEIEPVQEGFWGELDGKLEAERIFAAMEELTPPYRMAVQLCDVEELTYEEAADIMDVPIGTVRSRLSRARQMIREAILKENAQEAAR